MPANAPTATAKTRMPWKILCCQTSTKHDLDPEEECNGHEQSAQDKDVPLEREIVQKLSYVCEAYASLQGQQQQGDAPGCPWGGALSAFAANNTTRGNAELTDESVEDLSKMLSMHDSVDGQLAHRSSAESADTRQSGGMNFARIMQTCSTNSAYSHTVNPMDSFHNRSGVEHIPYIDGLDVPLPNSTIQQHTEHYLGGRERRELELRQALYLPPVIEHCSDKYGALSYQSPNKVASQGTDNANEIAHEMSPDGNEDLCTQGLCWPEPASQSDGGQSMQCLPPLQQPDRNWFGPFNRSFSSSRTSSISEKASSHVVPMVGNAHQHDGEFTGNAAAAVVNRMTGGQDDWMLATCPEYGELPTAIPEHRVSVDRSTLGLDWRLNRSQPSKSSVSFTHDQAQGLNLPMGNRRGGLPKKVRSFNVSRQFSQAGYSTNAETSDQPSQRTVIIGELIGKGSNGLVHKGLWNGKLVAIKVMTHETQQQQQQQLIASRGSIDIPPSPSLGASRFSTAFQNGTVPTSPSQRQVVIPDANTTLGNSFTNGSAAGSFFSPQGEDKPYDAMQNTVRISSVAQQRPLRQSFAGTTANLQDCLREANLALSLVHPNIVATYGMYSIGVPEMPVATNEQASLASRATPSYSVPTQASKQNDLLVAGSLNMAISATDTFGKSDSYGNLRRASQDMPNSPRARVTRTVSQAGYTTEGLSPGGRPVTASATSGQPYQTHIVMEYCAGGCLRKHLDNARTGQLDLPLVLSLCWDLCCAIEYMHNQQLRHGDIKAANVLLCPLQQSTGLSSPPAFTAKLADFGTTTIIASMPTRGRCTEYGAVHVQEHSTPAPRASISLGVLAHSHDRDNGKRRMSKLGSQSGKGRVCWLQETQMNEALTVGTDATSMFTPSHSAPEILLGQSTPSLADDVYALGVTIWEIVTGQRAYHKMRNLDLLQSKMSKPTHTTLTFPEGMCEDLIHLCHSCWQPVASRPSATEVRAHMQDILAEVLPDQDFRLPGMRFPSSCASSSVHISK